MPIDARIEAEKLRQLYKEDPRQHSFNLLLLGETKTGKTYLMRTARFPVHIDSFDPGGTKGLRDYILKGDIVADTQFESEDPLKPEMYSKWKSEFEYRFNHGYFESFGTYVLDSATIWAEAIMNWILKKAGRAGEPPKFTKDYFPQRVEIRNYVRKMLDLPCDLVLTGHLEAIEDKVTGDVKWRFLTTGQGTIIIPLFFDELWNTIGREVAGGVKYQLLTKSTGPYLAGTVIGKESFETYEEPNIKALLKKAKWPCEDKPKLY